MTNKKTVLITGCSSGLGKAICRELKKNAYYVIATARNETTLSDVEADLKLSLDVTDEKSIEGVMDELRKKGLGIDLLINNAGFSFRSAIEEVDISKAQALFDVNVFGILRMTSAVLPIMRKQGSGRILNIGSISGKMT